MFNNKDNNYKFIGKEELEKAYRHQEKLFNSKIEEQQSQIDDLINFISARFGEDFKNSDVNSRIKKLEKNFQTIEDSNKANIEKNVKLLEDTLKLKINSFEDVINKSNNDNLKLFHEYNSVFQKNQEDINELKNIIAKKDQKIAKLNEAIEKYSNENEEYKKYIKNEFENTNKKISKINYMGITSKFDKKIKEENEKIKNKIQELGIELDEYVTITKQAMLEEQEGLSKCSKEVASFNDAIANNNTILNSKINDNKNELGALSKKIEEVDRENKQITNDAIKSAKVELKEQIDNIEKQTSSKILDLGKHFVESVENVDQKLNNKVQEINSKTDISLKEINDKSKLLDEQISNLKDNVNANYKNFTIWGKDVKEKQNNLSNLYKKVSADVLNTRNDLQVKLGTVNDELKKYLEEAEKYNNKIESRIKNQNEKINANTQTINETLNKYIENAKQNSSNLENIITKKEQENNIKFDDINKIINKYNEKTENIQEEYSQKLEAISNNILILKDEVQENLRNIENGDELTEFKKEQNDLIKKINKQLGLIQNQFAEYQKKNLENNKNLQLKIKTYVDRKIEVADSKKVNNLDEILEKVNLSIAEKEKIQRAETEELLNKKLKAIQKENERILNKKIEELNRQFQNNTITTPIRNPEYQINTIKPKKKVYDILDDSTILKQAASTNKELKTKEGKSQILKFFYDDDDLN